MMNPRLLPLLFWFVPLLAPISAPASGSYTARPPQPPSSVSVDANRYHRGKQIFVGKADLGIPSNDLAVQQTPRLKELQDKLPKAASKTVRLPDLAGKLSPAQMKALEYYLEVRYR